MMRQVIRVLDKRKKGAYLLMLECGHQKLTHWKGKMMMTCGDCLRGRRPAVAIAPAAKAPEHAGQTTVRLSESTAAGRMTPRDKPRFPPCRSVMEGWTPRGAILFLSLLAFVGLLILWALR